MLKKMAFIIFIVFLIASLLYFFISKKPVGTPDNAEKSVSWVKKPLRILYIDNKVLYSLDVPGGKKVKIYSPIDQFDLSADNNRVVLGYSKNHYFNPSDNDATFVVLSLRNYSIEHKYHFEKGGYGSPEFIDANRFVIAGDGYRIIDTKNDKIAVALTEAEGVGFYSKNKLKLHVCVDHYRFGEKSLCQFKYQEGLEEEAVVTCRNCGANSLKPQSQSQDGNYLIFRSAGKNKLYLYGFKEKRTGYLVNGDFGVFFKPVPKA